MARGRVLDSRLCCCLPVCGVRDDESHHPKRSSSDANDVPAEGLGPNLDCRDVLQPHIRSGALCVEAAQSRERALDDHALCRRRPETCASVCVLRLNETPCSKTSHQLLPRHVPFLSRATTRRSQSRSCASAPAAAFGRTTCRPREDRGVCQSACVLCSRVSSAAARKKAGRAPAAALAESRVARGLCECTRPGRCLVGRGRTRALPRPAGRPAVAVTI